MDRPKAKQPRKRTPRKITKSYLENASLHYLERYASSSNNFRQVLLRKVKRSCDFHGGTIEDFLPMVDELVERYQRAGLLNDEVFARGKVASLRRKGLGRQAILARLHPKGLSQVQIETALDAVDDDNENAELEAAQAYIKRKRLGKYRTRCIDDENKQHQRELASLARAGFGYEIASKVLGEE